MRRPEATPFELDATPRCRTSGLWILRMSDGRVMAIVGPLYFAGLRVASNRSEVNQGGKAPFFPRSKGKKTKKRGHPAVSLPSLSAYFFSFSALICSICFLNLSFNGSVGARSTAFWAALIASS